MAEPAAVGLEGGSSVCPSAHTDFDPGKRESLANIQCLPCHPLMSTVPLLGTSQQRDAAAHGPDTQLHYSWAQHSRYIHKTLTHVKHKHDKLFRSAVRTQWAARDWHCYQTLLCTQQVHSLVLSTNTLAFCVLHNRADVWEAAGVQGTCHLTCH